MVRIILALLGALLLLAIGCSEESGPRGDGSTTMDSGLADGPAVDGAGDGSSSTDGGPGPDADSGTGGDQGPSPDMPGDMPKPPACDYKLVNGMAVIEAEALKLSSSWSKQTTHSGYTGSGYIAWTGSDQMSTPGKGLLKARILFSSPGRHTLVWHTRIGKGSNTTEHNDTWVRFSGMGFYGLKMVSGKEHRVYPKPLCNDATKMAAIKKLSQVSEAKCPNGSSKDGWFKVYCSGASSWKWSARTSDNDGHHIMIEISKAGVYTMELSARSSHHLIDRIVIHQEKLANSTVQNLKAKPTPCP